MSFLENGFYVGAVIPAEKVYQKLLQRRRRSQNAHRPAIFRRISGREQEGNEEHRGAGQLVEKGVQRGKQAVFNRRGDICRGAEEKYGRRRVKYLRREGVPEEREQAEQHCRVEQQVGGAVQPCAEAACRMCPPGDEAVQDIGQPGEGVYPEKGGGKRAQKYQRQRPGNAGKREGVRNIQFVSGC